MRPSLRQLISPDKFVPIYLQRAAAAGRELGPLAVELHWTSDCNYDCIHCSYGSRRQGRGRLSDVVIESVVDDLVALRARAIYLSGGGEPLLVKAWQRVADDLLEAGVDVAAITNGIAITDAALATVRRMNYVAVSVYSTVREEYERITGSRQFVRQFDLPARVRNEPGRVVVGARCVLNDVNFHSLAPIYEEAIRSGFDYIIFIPAVDYEGKGLSLGNEKRAEVMKEIHDRRDRFDPDRTNALEMLARNVSHYERRDYRDKFRDPPGQCAAVAVRGNAFINYDGGVWLCQPHIGDMRHCIGNVNERRFSEIWNSERHLAAADLLHREFAAGRCGNCRSIGFNVSADRYRSGEIDPAGIPFDPFI